MMTMLVHIKKEDFFSYFYDHSVNRVALCKLSRVMLPGE